MMMLDRMNHALEAIADLKMEMQALRREVADAGAAMVSNRDSILARLKWSNAKMSDAIEDLTRLFASAARAESLEKVARIDIDALAQVIGPLRHQIDVLSARVLGPDDLH